MSSPSENACPARGNCCRFPLLLGFVLLALLLFRWFGPLGQESEQRPGGDGSASLANPDKASGKVSLSIDFGDGRQQDHPAISWRNGMTVADLLHEASELTISQKGTGATAFLTGINGRENAGADGKNWLYEVNGQVGDRSFAVYELRPGDRVLWTFRPRR